MSSSKEKIFLELVNRHKGILHKASRMYASDPEDQQDLQQEIMIQLWKAFESFKGESTFSTWMYRVAVNTAITCFKKEKKRTDTFSNQEAGESEQEEYNSSKDEQLEVFYKAIQLLSPIEKALMFYYMEGLSHKETGAQLGLSEGNVRVKLSRAKEKLQNIITTRQYELRRTKK